MRTWSIILGSAAILAFANVVAWAGTKAEIDKENGYVVVQPPTADTLIDKENGYVVVQPPTADTLIDKENGYAVVKTPNNVAMTDKINAYAIIIPAYPSVSFIQ